jgi:nuclear pore complex protein Nup98-Nup96
LDKATREPILDPEDPRVDAFISKLETMPETSFIGFNSNTGAWKFRVEHFSRYGLDDDEDEQVEVPVSTSKDTSLMDDSFMHLAARRGVGQQRVTDLNDVVLDDDEVLFEGDYYEEDGVVSDEIYDDEEILAGIDEDDEDYVEKVEEKVETFLMPDDESDFEDIIIRDEFDDTEMTLDASPPRTESVSGKQERKTPMKQLDSARKVASMKGVFFGASSTVKKNRDLEMFDESSPAPLRDDVVISPIGEKRMRGFSPDLSFQRPEVNDVDVAPPVKLQSRFGKAEKIDVGCVGLMDAKYGLPAKSIFVDAGLTLGRSFRVGWSPSGDIVTMRRYGLLVVIVLV